MKLRFSAYVKSFLLLCGIFCGMVSTMARAEGLTLIRDAEIEHTLRTYSDPIFLAAGLNPKSVRIFLIANPDINAFVAGGSNIFIHTGLIMAASRPDMLMGAIAHETGHIAGGHLARGTEAVKNAGVETVLSYVLGAAAAASGAADVGTAILSAGSQVAQRRFLAYSRSQEEVADQAAVAYLQKTHTSVQGMLDLFETLRKQESLYFGGRTPYVLTHPLSKERIALIRQHIQDAPTAEPPAYVRIHQRMLAKLHGFLDSPERVFSLYPQTDQDTPALYARAVAFYRQSNLALALKSVEDLIKGHPKDPFFYELQGQILFENARIDPAIEAYKKANSLLPDSPLIKLGLAKSMLASANPALLSEALVYLRQAEREDKTISEIFHQLAIAYGRSGDLGMAHLSLAEEEFLRGKKKAAKRQATIALEKLSPSSPARLRAEDIVKLSETDLP